MKQILYTGGKKGKSGTNDTNKVVIVFVVLIVVFAICLIGIGINLYTKVKNETGTDISDLDKPGQSGSTNTIVDQPGELDKPDKPDKPEEPKEPEIKSKISIKFDSQLGGVQLKVTSRQKLKTISYWWDEEEPTIVESEENEYEVVIASKQGTHTLNVEVIDQNDTVETAEQLVIGDSEPELQISTDGVSNYVIKAKDDQEIKRIVITLNGETQEIEVGEQQIEHKVQIPQGYSLIEVTVYNINEISVTKKAKITNFGG